MEIIKSKKFKNAYVIINDENFTTEHSEAIYNGSIRHLFLKEAKENKGNMQVPYVFYSRTYRKWYEDIAYIPINTFNVIYNLIKE